MSLHKAKLMLKNTLPLQTAPCNLLILIPSSVKLGSVVCLAALRLLW